MTAAHHLGLSYAEYLALEERTGERHQFLDGGAWAMAGGTPAHAELAVAVTALLRDLGRGRCRVYSSDLKLRVVATGLTTYADGVVVCGPRESASDDANAVTNPAVIVEVLSDSTERYDRGEKFRHYRQMPSLRAYVLVSQHERAIEIYNRQGDRWTLTDARDGGAVRVDCLDGDLSVTAVYDGVTLAE